MNKEAYKIYGSGIRPLPACSTSQSLEAAPLNSSGCFFGSLPAFF